MPVYAECDNGLGEYLVAAAAATTFFCFARRVMDEFCDCAAQVYEIGASGRGGISGGHGRRAQVGRSATVPLGLEGVAIVEREREKVSPKGLQRR